MERMVGKQIDKLLKIRGDTSVRLALEMGVTKSTISNWTKGHTSVPLKYIYMLIQLYPGLSLEWLLFDRGNPFGGGNVQDSQREEMDHLHNNLLTDKHTGGGRLLEIGATIEEIRDHMGHKSIDTTYRYIRRHFGTRSKRIIENFPTPL